MPTYCASRKQTYRQRTREVFVGSVGIGGRNPIRVQSMTTSDTLDVEGTVRQSIALAEAGCEIVRITAPNTKAARALGTIRRKLTEAKIDVPLVADIHFTPKAAMEAAEHVEKVRINPGNYADRKKFKIREYSDNQYEEELERLFEAFSPIVLKCKSLDRAMRIGTNHGSLSDRIMNRYGDSPLGMVESALEFIRICEHHGFRNLVLSMKASNPKVMIEAYRLAMAKMLEEDMNYPLHLGVTEAGDGEDARIKSTVGIGALLYDGLGDTIRVSLTEDSVYEIPVARELARRAMESWIRDEEGNVIFADEVSPAADNLWHDSLDPFDFRRRLSAPLEIQSRVKLGEGEPPLVFIPADATLDSPTQIIQGVAGTHVRLKDSRIEGLMVTPGEQSGWSNLSRIREALGRALPFFILESPESPESLNSLKPTSPELGGLIIHLHAADLRTEETLEDWVAFAREKGALLALSLKHPEVSGGLEEILRKNPGHFLLSLEAEPGPRAHPLGQYRILCEGLKHQEITTPIWLRNTRKSTLLEVQNGQDSLIEASLLSGALLCDGIGDCISLETSENMTRATSLAYNILQGAKARISKTEFVACPSCGRTLFDLQYTTKKIKAQTHHLKGVTIAIMGCIVNGPGEMADADFGYVGGAPGKVNLYVGKTPVVYNVPEAEAVDRLVELIRSEGKWTDPPAEENASEASKSGSLEQSRT